MKVQRNGRSATVEVSSDGEGLVSRAGSALLGRLADHVGLSEALGRALGPIRERRGSHDPGRVMRDLAVMLADGGEALSDLGAIREQAPLFGAVASDSTAYRLIDRISQKPELLEAIRAARAEARAHVWDLGLAPEQVTIDLDATLIASHSEKDRAAGNFKGGYGFHPMMAYFDESSESAAGMLRAGNAGANTAVDQIAVAADALSQIPAAHTEGMDVLLRVDTAGATHDLLDWARQSEIRFSVGFDLTEAVREAITSTSEGAWSPAQRQDGSERPNGEVAEITDALGLEGWPEGSRVLVRRERPHPGAQLTFTDHEGHRFQAILTDQSGEIACLERRHRARARVENQIKDDKDTGMAKLPFRDFEMNAVWLELVGIAHDLLCWTKALVLEGDLKLAEPKRLRHRLLHQAGRLAFSGRRAKLRLSASWAWAAELADAFARLEALPEPAG